MKLRIAPIMLLFLVLSLMAQEKNQISKIKIYIKELKMNKTTGILISENEMTKIVFDEIEKVPDFDVKIVSRNITLEELITADLVIEGDYELDESLISLKYEIRSMKTNMRFKQSASRVDLSVAKSEIFTNFSELFNQVTFLSEPSLVDIEIDGNYAGKTPLTINYLLEGDHLISFAKDGYFTTNVEYLDFEKKDTIRVELTKQSYNSEATAPQPKGGIGPIIKNIQHHKNVQNNLDFERGLEGEIIANVEVDQNANVTKVEIFKSFGNSQIDEATLDAIKSAEWIPSKSNGKSIAGSTRIKIRFKGNR
ncbi:TonB family protein [candidate division KSB1 bacterium]|nr:TonB family protein [candidate division KSB1 bacterium]